MDTNTVQLVEQFGNKLDSYVSAIASKAGVAADHFYPIFVRQQVIEGACMISVMVIIALLLVVACWIFKKNADLIKSDNNETRDKAETMTMIYAGACLGLGLVFIITVCGTGSESLGKILNPEYYAVHSLITMIR